MALFDLSLPELQRYLPDLPEPADFDAFWATSLAQDAHGSRDVSFHAVPNGLATIETYDVTFAGFAGHPIRGWLHLPVLRGRALPLVVEYLGYGSGRGLAHEHTLWANAGYAHFVMDTRGQGTVTPDPDTSAGDVSTAGFLTRGLSDPHRHYYRRVFVDAVRAVDAARSHPDVATRAVAVTGGSQGGGIALAVAGLVPDLVAVMPDVPFLCDFPRASTLADNQPYVELQAFLKRHRDKAAAATRTLSYVDVVSHARRANAPALFSVALMDQVCPPSTVFGAFNHYGSQADLTTVDKEIRVYPYNGHEGGGPHHAAEKIDWLAKLLAGAAR